MSDEGYEVQIRIIECKKRNEPGDEIYLERDGVELRPPGSPDYWLFEADRQRRFLRLNVLDGPEGTRSHLQLREQDGGFRWSHDVLGKLTLEAKDGSITFHTVADTRYVGKRHGYHVVDFHGAESHYALHFVARRVIAI